MIKLDLSKCNVKDLICSKEYEHSNEEFGNSYKQVIKHRFKENYVVFCDTSMHTVLAAKTKRNGLKFIKFIVLDGDVSDIKESEYDIAIDKYDDLYTMESIELN